MDWLQEIAQNTDAPLIAAFALGLPTAIAPCPLATNISATAYIARHVQDRSTVLWSGVLYTLGRMMSYTAIAAVIYFGASQFNVAKIFQGTGEKFLGFVLLLIGFIMLDIIKLSFLKGSGWIDKIADRLKKLGKWGSFLLGAIFALAFCPYSGALYFGMLLPMTVASESGLMIPVLFSVGTGLPVILFAFVIAFSMEKLGQYFKAITKVEKVMRVVAGITFVITGLYYINIYLDII
jgi:cytochrome c-type biogenesis protein